MLVPLDMLLLFKILFVPAVIAAISIAGRFWGPGISGLLGGLPVVAGPILVFLALDHGEAFAASSAQAALAGVISIGIFCYSYARASLRFGMMQSVIISLSGFALSTCLLYVFELSITCSLIIAVLLLIVFRLTFPKISETANLYLVNLQDVILRMFAAACLVLLITFTSEALGPRLRGLLAPFPIAGTILAVFTHTKCGADATRRLLSGFINGLFGMAIFDVLFATQVTNLGVAMTTLIAVPLALATSSLASKAHQLAIQ